MTDLTDNRTWRKILAKMHPDTGGEEELFVFLKEVRDELVKQKKITDEIRGEGPNRVRRFESPIDTAGTVKPWWQMGGR